MPVFVTLPWAHTPDASLSTMGTAWPVRIGPPIETGTREQSAITPGISVNPEIMGGTPVIEGTRIPVFVILEMLEGGYAAEAISQNFGGLIRDEHVDAARRYGQLNPRRPT
jgi:uncharacterized protein (DUF433 family)